MSNRILENEIMKVVLLTLSFLIIVGFSSIGQLDTIVQGKYQYDVYHEPEPATYFEGRYIGKRELAAAQPGYTEQVWSPEYWLDVSFYSGRELYEKFGRQDFEDNKIICIVFWSNGGNSEVEVENYVINTKEIRYENIEGLILEGHDREGRFWKLYP